jgi:hypothetical protein
MGRAGSGVMSKNDERRFADLYRSGASRREWHGAFPGVSDGVFNGRITKLGLHRTPRPGRVVGLRPDNAAVVDGRTKFPSMVRDPRDAPALLQPGQNSAKLGGVVSKGAWRGFPIYSLTLEERATCPRSCHNWLACMGNGMQWSWRNRHGPELEFLLWVELVRLQRRHSGGFVVRLHLLGDFPTVAYLDLWASWLDEFPALRVFGYSAWSPDTPIGAAVHGLATRRWDRFAVRLSSTDPGPRRAITLWEMPPKQCNRNGIALPPITCPAQLGRTKSCGSCGICWSPAAQERTIAFIAHGPVAGRKKAAS